MANLEVNFCGVRIKNPVVASSAEPTLNAHNMKKCIDAGAGAVIVKTMTDSEPMRELTTRSKWRFLNERHEVCRGKVPRCFTLYGRSGLALETPEEFLPQVYETVRYAENHDAVVIGSIASTELEGWVRLAKQMEDTGVPLIECNFGCPHPHMMPGVKTGMEVGQDFDYACDIAKAVCKAVSVPVMIKVTPQVASLIDFCGRLLDVGVRAVTLTNRFIGFVPDIETGKPLIYGQAGVGGPWTKPLTLRWVHNIRQAYGDKVFIAGTLAQAHAEILACMAVSQLVNPGAPVVYTSFARGVNMKTGDISMACPEFGILKVAMAQMGRFLDLPVRMPGMLRDAKLLDAQAGFETGMIGTVTALAADIMDSMQLDMDMVVDFADLLFCDECMGAIQRFTKELVVNEETLALDVIGETGPGGNFLAHRHTFTNFRKELWMPGLFERRSWEAWQRDGSRDVREVARQKLIEILEKPLRPLLGPEVAERIDKIAREAQGENAH